MTVIRNPSPNGDSGLKNPENLTMKEQIQTEKLQEKKLSTAKAYQMKLFLQDIYAQTTEERARKKFRLWCRWVRFENGRMKSTILKPMQKVAQMIENHLEGILVYWRSGTTNAFMEAINSVFSAIKRRARGFRTISYLINVLYFHFGNFTSLLYYLYLLKLARNLFFAHLFSDKYPFCSHNGRGVYWTANQNPLHIR